MHICITWLSRVKATFITKSPFSCTSSGKDHGFRHSSHSALHVGLASIQGINMGLIIKSLWPSDAIWYWSEWVIKFYSLFPTMWHWSSGSTLVKVMACCLMAPSHYLNQCWLSIKGVLWHSLKSNSTSADELKSVKCVRWLHFKMTTTTPRSWWVNAQMLKCHAWYPPAIGSLLATVINYRQF